MSKYLNLNILFGKQNLVINIPIFISWLLLILSVGANSSDLVYAILNFVNGNFGIKEIFKFAYFRSGVVYIIFILFLIFFIINRNYLKINRNFGLEDLFITLFFLYTFVGIIGLNLSCNYKDNFLNINDFICENGNRKNFWFTIHFSIASINLALVYIIISIRKEIFLTVTFSTLFFLIILSFFLIFNNQLEYGGIELKIPLLNFNIYMNSNGQGRLLLILLVFFQCLIFSSYFKYYNLKIILKLTVIIIGSIIFSLEGKFNSLMFIFCSVVSVFYISKDNFKKKIINILVILIIPFLIYQAKLEYDKITLPNAKCLDNSESCLKEFQFIKEQNSNRLFKTNFFNKKKSNLDNSSDNSIKNIINNNEELVKENKSGYLSTRKQKWIFLINDVLERNYFFGNGPEYDRQLLIYLADTKGAKRTAVNSDAANGLIYGFLTSGIFGLIFYIYSIFYLIINLIKYFFVKKEKSILLNFGFFCLGIVIMRSLIENSFMSWNFDQFLMIGAIILIKCNLDQLQIKKY